MIGDRDDTGRVSVFPAGPANLNSREAAVSVVLEASQLSGPVPVLEVAGDGRGACGVELEAPFGRPRFLDGDLAAAKTNCRCLGC